MQACRAQKVHFTPFVNDLRSTSRCGLSREKKLASPKRHTKKHRKKKTHRKNKPQPQKRAAAGPRKKTASDFGNLQREGVASSTPVRAMSGFGRR